MAVDVTEATKQFGSIVLFFGITAEQLILVLYPTFLLPTLYFWYCDVRRRRFSTTVPAGCTRLGMVGKSNTADEFDKKYDEGTTDQKQWKVKAIYIHPIKSCAPLELDVANVTPQGLEHDRQYCFAEKINDKWTFRTLRQPGYEKLALVQTEVWLPKQSAGIDPGNLRKAEREGALVIRYPNEATNWLAPLDRLMMKWGLVPSMVSFQVPLYPDRDRNYPQDDIKVWHDDPKWLNMSQHVPQGLKEWLGIKNEFSLFRADTEALRKVFRNAPKVGEAGYQPAIGFQDAYPLNLMNIASVHDIGRKVGKAINGLSVRRFRSNFILQGPPAYDEDDWKKIKIGGYEIDCSCHCVRCRLPNVDPDTGIRHASEPDKTLKSFRCIDQGDENNACLGLQLSTAKGESFQVRTGDSIEVLERGEHFYLKHAGKDEFASLRGNTS